MQGVLGLLSFLTLKYLFLDGFIGIYLWTATLNCRAHRQYAVIRLGLLLSLFGVIISSSWNPSNPPPLWPLRLAKLIVVD